MAVTYSDVKTRLEVRVEYRKPSWPKGKTLSSGTPMRDLEWKRKKLAQLGFVIVKEHEPKPVEYFDVSF